MKIALALYALEMGGIESFLRALAVHFDAAGHEVTFLETQHQGRWSQAFRDHGFNVIGGKPSPWRSKIAHAHDLARQLQSYDAVLSNDTPVLQSAFGLLPTTCVCIPILHLDLVSMIRCVLGARGQWDAIACVNTALRDILINYADVATDRVVSIPNGITPTDHWDKSVVDHPLNIVFIGRIEDRQKGVMLLPDIADQMAARDIEFVLHVIGDGPDRDRLLEQLQSVSSHLCFHGPLSNSDTMMMLKKMDVLLMPSYYEGLPIALLEAMARGVVPVVSWLPGATDLPVRNDHNGWLVQPGDTAGFITALTTAATDRQRLKTMSKAAWTTIRDRFSSERMATDYLTLIATHRERRDVNGAARSGAVDRDLLGDLPSLPACAVRPIRKALRLAGLWTTPPISANRFAELDDPATLKRLLNLEIGNRTGKHR